MVIEVIVDNIRTNICELIFKKNTKTLISTFSAEIQQKTDSTKVTVFGRQARMDIFGFYLTNIEYS